MKHAKKLLLENPNAGGQAGRTYRVLVLIGDGREGDAQKNEGHEKPHVLFLFHCFQFGETES